MFTLRSSLLPLRCLLLLSAGACQTESLHEPVQDEPKDESKADDVNRWNRNFCEQVCHEVCHVSACVTVDKTACEYLDLESCQQRSDCKSLLEGNSCEAVCSEFGVKELYACVTKDKDHCESLNVDECKTRSDCKGTEEEMCESAFSSFPNGQLRYEWDTLNFCLDSCRKN